MGMTQVVKIQAKDRDYKHQIKLDDKHCKIIADLPEVKMGVHYCDFHMTDGRVIDHVFVSYGMYAYSEEKICKSQIKDITASNIYWF